MDKQREILLHLSLIKGIGPATINHLIQNVARENLANLYHWSEMNFMACGITKVQAQLITTSLKDKNTLKKELELLNTYKINFVTIIDDTYPTLLKQIHYPPPILYIKGNLSLEQKCLAVVGSRKANNYGQCIIDQLIPPLVVNDWHIVSGGALGADAMAHHATLQAHGKTIVVLGSGLLKLSPKTNLQLFKNVIEKGGALISSFPLQEEGFKGNFPARNRIISGLSRGCLVVQAAERSGASITASFSLEQGREVFAIPGPIDDELSVGCHRLIQQGAKLVTHVDDILIEFGETLQRHDIQQETITYSEETNRPLSIQEKILIACKNPQSIDALIEQMGKKLDTIQSILFDLHLQGKITQDLSGSWHAL